MFIYVVHVFQYFFQMMSQHLQLWLWFASDLRSRFITSTVVFSVIRWYGDPTVGIYLSTFNVDTFSYICKAHANCRGSVNNRRVKKVRVYGAGGSIPPWAVSWPPARFENPLMRDSRLGSQLVQSARRGTEIFRQSLTFMWISEIYICTLH